MEDPVRELVDRSCVLVDELAQLPVQCRTLGTGRAASGEGEHEVSSVGVSSGETVADGGRGGAGFA